MTRSTPHVADTLAAGGGLCDTDAVRSIVSDVTAASPNWSIDGARFDEAEPGRSSLTREGGHSRRRVIHAGGDATGAEVQRALRSRRRRPSTCRRNHVALQVLRPATRRPACCVLQRGADIGHDHGPCRRPRHGRARPSVLGDQHEPDGSTGDGVALALAGRRARSATSSSSSSTRPCCSTVSAGGRRPLVTEALRGEGAVLIDRPGRLRSPPGVHPLGDLAPRDVVARPSMRSLAGETGDSCAILDATGITPSFARRFPTVTARA